MRSKPFKILLLFLSLMDLRPAFGGELVELNTSVRALGMGNAYAAAVKDADALFYNPAGIARISGLNWTIANMRAGINGLETLEDVSDMQGSSTFESAVRNLYGDHIWVGGGGKAAFAMPYFAAAVYDALDASVDINNPVYPNFDLSVINDLGYTVGGAFPLGPVLQFGTAIRYIQRVGARVPFGPTYISTLDPDTIQTAVEREGNGYAMDIGLNASIPGPVSPVFSFVWKNVGITKYKGESPTISTPPRDVDEMSVGAALDVDAGLVSVMPVFDFKYLNRADVQLGKKIHLGVEIGIPMIDIRAGFSEGYYTLGMGLNLGLFRMDAATYGVELGEYPGQREDRRYVVEFTMELGFDPSLGTVGGGSGGSGSRSAKGSGGGGSKSGWGGRKLKSRR